MDAFLRHEDEGQKGIEAKLTAIWADALHLDPEQIQTDLPFLALGGDSLSAMLCISRVRSLFSVEIDIHDFFVEGASIRHLASSISSNEISPREPS